MTTVKITELANIGANLATSTFVPVVNMVGTPTTQKTTVGGIANLILEGAGVDYPEATVALLAQTVSNAAQPNITSVGTLTNVVVSGNATVNGNITSNGTAYVGNLSTTGIATITTLAVGTTANLGAVGNVTITGGTAGQVLSTNGNGVLSWASDATSYGNSNVANYLPTFTGNIGANVVTANLFSGNGTNLTNIAGANVSGFVPNANVANTAFSVAAANVSGLGNIATTNYDGNASNVLHGDGTWSADTTTYGNSNVVTLLSAFGSNTITTTGNVSVGNITANNLGNISNINLDGNVSNLLTGTGTYVAIPVVPTVGNIATINLTGSNSNVLYGNGVFAAVTVGNLSQISNGNSNVTLTDTNGNVYINTNGGTQKQWIFDTAGNLRTPGNVDIYGAINFPQQVSSLNWSTYNIELSQYGRITTNVDFFANANTIGALYLKGDGSNISNIAGANVSGFVPNANVANTAFAVAAANVSGLGNIATVNLDGNVSNLLTGNGTYVAIPTVPTVGNIATINLDGNSQTWLAGNGVFANITIPSVGNIATINLDGSSSNVLYGNGVFAAVAGGNANTGNVTFNDINIIGTGNLKLQPDSANANAYLDIYLTAGPDIHIAGNGETVILGTDDYANVAVNIDGNVSIQAGNVSGTQTWNFGTDGNLTLPANTFAVNYANGTQVSIGGGGNTGNVTFDDNIVIGTGDEYGFSGLYLAVGPDSIANGTVQYLRVRGGDAPTHIHLDTGNNQFYDQYFGDDTKYVKLELGEAGNVVVGTDDDNGNLYSWSFTSDGNLILADGNSVIQSIANSSLDILNPNVSTMVLTPDSGYNSQALVLDPTGPGHIHLRAPGANIDEPSANLFLGGEASSFEVGEYNGAVPNLFIHSNNNTWMFDIDGNITFPRDGSNISTDPYLKILGGPSPQILSEDASLAGPANLAIVTDYLNLSGSNGNKIILQADAGAIATDAAMVLSTNLADPGNIVSWTLDTTGNLTLPDTSSVLANVSITLEANDTGNITGLNLIGDYSANLYAHGNVTIVSDISNTNATWAFGTNGNLTLPGNLVIAGNTSVFGTNASLLQTTDDRPLLALSSGANGAVSSLWVEDIGNVGTSNIAAVYANPTSGSKIVRIAVGQNGGNTGPNLWDFGTTGILTLPQGSQISETANTSVNITANANTWAFGVDGNLTVPGSIINDTSIVLSAPAVFNICTIATAGSGYNTGSSLKATTGGSGTGMTVGIGYGLSNQLTSVSVVNPGTGYVNGDVITVSEGTGGTFVITKYNVLANQTNNNTVQTDLIFANNTLTIPVDGNLVGNLIVPGSIVSSGASPAPYISGFSSVSALQFKNGNSNVTVNANSNLWTFDSTGNLTIPGSSGGFIKTVANASIGVAAVDNGTNNPAQLLSMTNAGVATSIISAYATNAIIQTNAAGAINTWQFDNAGNLTLPANAFAINYANGTQVSLGGGNVTWAQIDDKAGNSGPTIITLGQNAGFDGQGNAAIAIGKNAGAGGQGASSITIGEDAGGNITQGANSVAIGRSAGFDGQGIGAVAIGSGAGSNTQGNQSVAIGENAGVIQGSTAVAIGQNAGGGVALQGDDAVAIGHGAGSNAQGTQSVAIGLYAGQTTQGVNAIAIGANAGITSQGNNSIIINATGANLNQTTANTFTVAPVRNDTSNIAEVMFYNATSKEVTYGNTISVAGNVTAGNIYATNIVAETPFSIQTANFNANVGGRYGVDTTSGAVTSTLPASPSTGGAIFFADAGGAFASNNLTINPNGQTIMGASGNMTVSNNNQSFGLFFNGATWRTYN